MIPPFAGKLPPHSVEAEQGVAGCCLMDSASIDACSELQVTPDWFYDLRHRTIFEIILDLRASTDAPIDIIVIAQKLKDASKLDSIGGIGYLSDLIDAVPSVSNLQHYVGIAREKWTARRLIRAAQTIIERASAGEEEMSAVLDSAEVEILAVRGQEVAASERTAKQMAHSILNRLEDRIKLKGQSLPTGIRGIDRHLCLGGMRPGQNIVLAARPSIGKTALAGQIVANVCESGGAVGWFSLEMMTEEIEDRLASTLSGLPVGSYIIGNPPQERDYPRIGAAVSRVNRWKLRIDDSSDQTMPRIRSVMRRWMKQMGKLDLVVIDYMQLVTGTRKGAKREEEVASISKAVKAAAKELKVPVLSLCQLNRDLEKEKSRKPRLSDLRESGAIEQDADIVLALYDANPAGEDSNPSESVIGVEILKQRGGARFVGCRLKFEKAVSRITDIEYRPD